MLCRRSSCGSCSDAVTLSPPSPGTAARGVSAGAVRNRGRGAACPGSCCPVRPRTPPDNGSRASRHRYRSSQHTFSLTPFKDSQMYKLYRRKWISSEKKTNQNKNTLIQRLTLLLLLRTPGRGIKSWRLTLQHPSPSSPPHTTQPGVTDHRGTPRIFIPPQMPDKSRSSCAGIGLAGGIAARVAVSSTAAPPQT